jgi:hypothetical protein
MRQTKDHPYIDQVERVDEKLHDFRMQACLNPLGHF